MLQNVIKVCEASAMLLRPTRGLIALQRRVPLEEVGEWVWCDLDRHIDGDHYGWVCDAAPDGASGADSLWLVWQSWRGPLRVEPHGFCRDSGKALGVDELCWLPARHSGEHSWQRYLSAP